MIQIPPTRRSGPVPSEETTAMIRAAVVAELVDHGYQQLSFEKIARRAGVGKAAIYRRHGSRQDLVLDTIAYYATDAAAAELWPDTGSLAGDIAAFVTATARYLEDPRIARITADILAVVVRDEQFGIALDQRAGGLRRKRAIALVRRAITRGELPKTCDTELAADLLGAPIYWRLVVRRGHAPKSYRERLITATLAAMRAAAR